MVSFKKIRFEKQFESNLLKFFESSKKHANTCLWKKYSLYSVKRSHKYMSAVQAATVVVKLQVSHADFNALSPGTFLAGYGRGTTLLCSNTALQKNVVTVKPLNGAGSEVLTAHILQELWAPWDWISEKWRHALGVKFLGLIFKLLGQTRIWSSSHFDTHSCIFHTLNLMY